MILDVFFPKRRTSKIQGDKKVVIFEKTSKMIDVFKIYDDCRIIDRQCAYYDFVPELILKRTFVFIGLY